MGRRNIYVSNNEKADTPSRHNSAGVIGTLRSCSKFFRFSVTEGAKLGRVRNFVGRPARTARRARTIPDAFFQTSETRAECQIALFVSALCVRGVHSR